jgi:anti-sigma factor RsiW
MDDRSEIRELLGAWALDAVDDVERARVERAIRQDPALAREARALLETAARLGASAASSPPPALRADVVRAVQDVPQRRPERADAAPAQVPGGRRPRAGMWIAAAAIATIGIAAPTVLAIQQASRAARAEEEVAVLAEAITRPGVRVVSSEVTGGGRAVAVMTEDDALFVARGLPSLAAGRAYQLWVLEGEGPTSAGVIEVSDAVVSVRIRLPRDQGGIAMTIEPAGGSRQPTTEPIVVLAQGAALDEPA